MQYLRRPRGFTLIEIMITLVIIGILAAVALPSFQQYLQRSRRADAHSQLAAIAQAQERFRSNNVAYADTLAALGIKVTSQHYDIALVPLPDTATYVGGYEIHAMPKPGGVQAGDKACADMYISMSSGQMFYKDTNSQSTTAKAACWPQ